jgi:hypothetical protein
MSRWRGLKDLLQEAVEKGTTAVEHVHKDVARKPFAILQHVPLLASPARVGWSLVERVISETYQTIRLVNRVVGDLAGEALDAADRRGAERSADASQR